LSSLTVKLGVFSLWNGQQAFHSRPAWISFTDGMMTLDKVVRALSSSRKAVERLMRERNFLAADSQGGKQGRCTYPQLRARAALVKI
jgi:hypothetical protein